MTMKTRTYIHFIILEVTSVAVGPSAPPIIPTEADFELHPNKPSTQTNAKTNATNFFTQTSPFSSSYLSFFFIASFAFVLQTRRTEPPPYNALSLYNKSATFIYSISPKSFICSSCVGVARQGSPRCSYAMRVTHLPRGVRLKNPICIKYGSYISSRVIASSPTVAASVSRPTGPPS